jgi:hypothetical protein
MHSISELNLRQWYWSSFIYRCSVGCRSHFVPNDTWGWPGFKEGGRERKCLWRYTWILLVGLRENTRRINSALTGIGFLQNTGQRVTAEIELICFITCPNEAKSRVLQWAYHLEQTVAVVSTTFRRKGIVDIRNNWHTHCNGNSLLFN